MLEERQAKMGYRKWQENDVAGKYEAIAAYTEHARSELRAFDEHLANLQLADPEGGIIQASKKKAARGKADSPETPRDSGSPSSDDASGKTPRSSEGSSSGAPTEELPYAGDEEVEFDLKLQDPELKKALQAEVGAAHEDVELLDALRVAGNAKDTDRDFVNYIWDMGQL